MLGEGMCGSGKVGGECFPEKVTFEQGLDSDGLITMMLSGECSRHREQQGS